MVGIAGIGGMNAGRMMIAPTIPRPDCIIHADWGTSPRKRWLSLAAKRPTGGYLIHAPEEDPFGAFIGLCEMINLIMNEARPFYEPVETIHREMEDTISYIHEFPEQPTG